MTTRLKCEGCGGAVEYNTREQAAACLFCGLHALVLDEDAESQPFAPDCLLPIRLDQAQADAAYRAWARASWWRPSTLRGLSVQTHAVFLPAWRFECELDTHWAGLRRAATASGKAPKVGRQSLRVAHVVPASGGLTSEELWGLWPYDTEAAQPFAPNAIPHELPAKSRKRAAGEVHLQVQQRHRQLIAEQHGLTRCNVMGLVNDLDAKTIMVPVYVGVFRFRDQAWRFLVNGEDGTVVAKAPVDRVKVALVVSAGLALLSLLLFLYAR